MPDHPPRRSALRRLASLALLPLAALFPHPRAMAAKRLRPTPADDLGPFYPPAWRGEIDTDLTRFDGRLAQGRALALAGSVRDTSGQAIAGATVEIWHADAHGRYRHPGVDPRTLDPGFQGFGRSTTDAAGEYAFATIYPGNYGSRPPHIHFRVLAPGGRELVTQMYFNGNQREGNGFAPPEREWLTVALSGHEADGRVGFAARFDLVLEA